MLKMEGYTATLTIAETDLYIAGWIIVTKLKDHYLFFSLTVYLMLFQLLYTYEHIIFICQPDKVVLFLSLSFYFI